MISHFMQSPNIILITLNTKAENRKSKESSKISSVFIDTIALIDQKADRKKARLSQIYDIMIWIMQMGDYTF